MSNQDKGSKSGVALLIGALAGAAAGYWLNTTQGKLWRKRTSEQARELSDDLQKSTDEFKTKAKTKAEQVSHDFKKKTSDIRTKVESEANQLQSKANELKTKGKQFVDEKTKQMKREDGATNSDAANAIKDGVEKAKRRLENLDSSVDNSL